MRIDLMNDLGAPATVTVIDLVTETAMPQWNEWAAYIVAGAGYLGAWQGFGGLFVKNVGIAAFPWAAKKLYTRVRAMGGGTTQLALRRIGPSVSSVSRYPAPAFSEEFAGVKLD